MPSPHPSQCRHFKAIVRKMDLMPPHHHHYHLYRNSHDHRNDHCYSGYSIRILDIIATLTLHTHRPVRGARFGGDSRTAPRHFCEFALEKCVAGRTVVWVYIIFVVFFRGFARPWTLVDACLLCYSYNRCVLSSPFCPPFRRHFLSLPNEHCHVFSSLTSSSTITHSSIPCTPTQAYH